MGWRFFKSLNLGLVRLNLSKAGLGISAGIGGLRFGLSGMKRPYVSLRFGPLSYFSNIRLSSGNNKEQENLQTQIDDSQIVKAPENGSNARPTPNQAILDKLRRK